MILSVIIPTYNEKELILTVMERVRHADTSPFVKEIIIVNDGSTDGTAEILNEHARDRNIKIIHHPQNLGKASAIKSALKIADGNIILIQDADLEYSPDDYKRLLSPFLEKDKTQVVYGSRFLSISWPANMKVLNWFANRIFTFLVNLLYHADITDEGTGYKAFRRDVINPSDIECSGFEFCPEITAKLSKRGIRIIEVPVTYTARDRKKGKKPGFGDGFKVLWTLIKYRFTS